LNFSRAVCTRNPTAAGCQIVSGEASLYVESHGTGPALICIPGAANVMEWYRPLFKKLSTERTVIAFDFRGVGRSQFTNELSMEILAQDVLTIADRFSIQNFDVMGQSMGSIVAQHLLVNHSERIRRAILLNSGVLRPDPELIASFEAGTLDHPVASFSHLDPNERIAQVGCSFFSKEFVTSQAYQEWLSWQAPLAAKTETVRGYLRVAITNDLSDHLSRIGIPTLVIGGTEDTTSPSENAEELASIIPQAKYIELAGGRHGMLYEQPEWVFNQVSQFLKN